MCEFARMKPLVIDLYHMSQSKLIHQGESIVNYNYILKVRDRNFLNGEIQIPMKINFLAPR